jgi:ABC-type siderophore export system fused ATPase/permease subunit
MQRIEEFLKEDEVPDWASSLKNNGSPCDEADDIGFEYATFEWNVHPAKKKNDSFQLGPLNVVFPKGKLTLVSGATGSGKTALLLSLLGGAITFFRPGRQ